MFRVFLKLSRVNSLKHLVILKFNKSMDAIKEIPKTLEGFGYEFDKSGKLRNVNDGSAYEFNVSSDTSFNQKYYEALGEIITEKVYQLLEEEGLQRLPVPPEEENSSFVFVTKNVNDADKLLILIHGSGVVRAGQWARSMIINDSLDSGTQLPYIRKALALGYGVYVLNTNDNYRIVNCERKPIKGSSSAEEHAHTVWENYILKSKAQKIAIVAHSFGGIVSMSLASQFEDDFLNRVFAIALTDSVHGKIPRAVSSTLAKHLANIAKNWVSSREPLDAPQPEVTGEIQCVSAGVPVHELTSWSAMSSVFKFIEDRSEQRLFPADGV